MGRLETGGGEAGDWRLETGDWRDHSFQGFALERIGLVGKPFMAKPFMAKPLMAKPLMDG